MLASKRERYEITQGFDQSCTFEEAIERSMAMKLKFDKFDSIGGEEIEYWLQSSRVRSGNSAGLRNGTAGLPRILRGAGCTKRS